MAAHHRVELRLIGAGEVEAAAAANRLIEGYIEDCCTEGLRPAMAHLAWVTPMIAAALVA
jgi:hypothetical protein